MTKEKKDEERKIQIQKESEPLKEAKNEKDKNRKKLDARKRRKRNGVFSLRFTFSQTERTSQARKSGDRSNDCSRGFALKQKTGDHMV